jgi:hypothetical protein
MEECHNGCEYYNKKRDQKLIISFLILAIGLISIALVYGFHEMKLESVKCLANPIKYGESLTNNPDIICQCSHKRDADHFPLVLNFTKS